MKDSYEQAILGDVLSEVSVLIVAGEPSGDRAAAEVARVLKRKHCVHLFGVGGSHLRGAGVELISDVTRFAGVGIGASFRSIKSWLKTWAELRQTIVNRRPKVALLVDSPEFNLPLARVLKEANIPVVYYIGPQVWAWRSNRLKLMKERTDNVALVLPFELPFYQKAHVRAEFVGHPIMDMGTGRSRSEIRAALHTPQGVPLVAMLPGSRRGEVEALAPLMIEAGISVLRNGGRPVLAPAPGIATREILDRASASGCLVLPEGITARELLRACDAALVASGTATLEAMVEGAPMAVVYKIDPLSWWTAGMLVKVPFVGLPNLLANREIVPEILQQDVDAQSLSKVAAELLLEPGRTRRIRDLADAAKMLGFAGASQRVAKMVSEFL